MAEPARAVCRGRRSSISNGRKLWPARDQGAWSWLARERQKRWESQQCGAMAQGVDESDDYVWEIWWCYDGWHDVADRLEKLLPPWARLHRMDPRRPLAEQVANARVLIPTTGDGAFTFFKLAPAPSITPAIDDRARPAHHVRNAPGTVDREAIYAAKDLRLIAQPAAGEGEAQPRPRHDATRDSLSGALTACAHRTAAAQATTTLTCRRPGSAACPSPFHRASTARHAACCWMDSGRACGSTSAPPRRHVCARSHVQAVAEVALCMMLMLSRRIDAARQAFADRIIGEPVGRQVSGKTLGIIGMGRVGKCLRTAAQQGLGMQVSVLVSAVGGGLFRRCGMCANMRTQCCGSCRGVRRPVSCVPPAIAGAGRVVAVAARGPGGAAGPLRRGVAARAADARHRGPHWESGCVLSSPQGLRSHLGVAAAPTRRMAPARPRRRAGADEAGRPAHQLRAGRGHRPPGAGGGAGRGAVGRRGAGLPLGRARRPTRAAVQEPQGSGLAALRRGGRGACAR